MNTQNSPSSRRISAMDLARFETLVQTYGARPQAWPESEREGALELLVTNSDAASLAAEESRLDSLLNELGGMEPAPQLGDQIVQLALASEPRMQGLPWAKHLARWVAWFWPFGATWKPVTAMAVAGVAGLVVGFVLPAETEETQTYIADTSLTIASNWEETP